MNITRLEPRDTGDTQRTSKRAFVTGGAGFIGHHVVRALIDDAEDWLVRVLARPGESIARLDDVADEIEIVEGDVLDAERLETLMEGCSHVFHLAAIYEMWTDRPRSLWDVNILGTMNVLNAAIALRVERVVHTSSIVTVGQRKGEVSDESVPFDRWDTGNDYMRSKYLSEEVALRMGRHIEVVVVNPAMPIGPGDSGPTQTGQLLLDTLSGDVPPIFFKGSLNLADVRDVARGHVLAMRRGDAGERYILGGHNIDMSSLRNLLSDVCGVPARRMMPVPGRLVELLGSASEAVADHITHTRPQLTFTTVSYLREGLRLSCGKAARKLGYKVRPLASTLRDAQAWFVEHGMLE